MKKRLTFALVLAVIVSMVFSGVALAWDEEDPEVANNEDFVYGGGNGMEEFHFGGQWSYGGGDEHNLYRDDVTDTGNLDSVWIHTETPDAIDLPSGLYYMEDESADTWYWATEPRGIDYPEPKPKPRNPNRFTVSLKWGWQAGSRFVSEKDNTIRSDIEAVGKYDETQYMLSISAGTVIERPSGDRPHQLNLRDIDGDKLTFGQIDVLFSKPCVLYVEEGEDEWVEVGSFTSIVDRTAHLD